MMKWNKTAVVLSLSLLACASAQAANNVVGSVSKKITLTAQISDSIFVSRPDGSSWYNTEELEATDNKQQHFSKILPVRVWSKNKDFSVSLAQPLTLSSGYYEMQHPTVTMATPQGDVDVKYGNQSNITQVASSEGGYDSVYNLTIDVDAPPAAEKGSPSTNGSYTGDLVMLFEPSAAVLF